uniref:NADH-ubiquinone oxidoreductase chain 4L n=2 Tax=Proscopiini TaxID=443288 RepID=A0A0N7AY60_9ORTH|nr:NADH dehydrogenase subunit 4L [Proscopia sp. HS-2014]
MYLNLLMYLFPFFLFLFIYLVGVYVFSSSRKHLLMSLLSLEYIVISLYGLLSIYLVMYDYELFFLIIFLVLSVCEGALGLSVLVSMVRSHGNDFLNSLSVSLC